MGRRAQTRQCHGADHVADFGGVLAGEDRDNSRERGGLRCIDGANVGGGVRAAYDGGPVHAGQHHVLNISGGAGEQARVFATTNALAYELVDFRDCGGHGLRCRLCRGTDRVHNVLIAGTAADIAVEAVANFLVCGIGVAFENLFGNHEHARGTETALETVFIPVRFLNGMHFAVCRGESFNGQDAGAVGLDGEHGAALDGFAIHVDGASSADGGFRSRRECQ